MKSRRCFWTFLASSLWISTRADATRSASASTPRMPGTGASGRRLPGRFQDPRGLDVPLPLASEAVDDRHARYAAGRRPAAPAKMIVALNGGPEVFPDNIQQKVSFLYAEPLDSPTGIALGTIFLRGWGRPDYQAGVFNWRDYADRNSGGKLRVQADAIAMQNARVFFVGEAPMVSGIEGGRGYTHAGSTWPRKPGATCGTSIACWKALSRSPGDDALQPGDARRDGRAAPAHRLPPIHARRLGTLDLHRPAGESIPDFRLSPELLARFDTLAAAGSPSPLRRRSGTNPRLGAARRNARRQRPLRIAGREARPARQFRPERSPRRGLPFRGEQYAQNYVESAGKKGTGPICAEHPPGRSGKLDLSPFSLVAEALGPSTVGFPGSFLNIKPTLATGSDALSPPLDGRGFGEEQVVQLGTASAGQGDGGPAVTLHRFGKGQALYLACPLFRLWGASSAPLDSGVAARTDPGRRALPAHRASHPSALGIRPWDVLLR